MQFARKVWKLLVAIKDGLALVLLLLFFLGLYAVLSARPGTTAVRDGALLLSFNGTIVEEPEEISPFTMLLSSGAPVRQYGVHDVVRALRGAARDDHVKAVVLNLSRFTGAGQVHLDDVGAALDTVRKANKPVLAYSMLYTDDAIQLAAHASEVWVDPLGGAIPTGPGGTHLYYGPLLDKLKITAHVYRVGSFKSAVEPYIRGDMSPEAKENYKALYGALWNDWRADVARARPKANIAMATGDAAAWLKAAGGDAARAALAAGLVDRIGAETQFGQRVAGLVGKSTVSARPGRFAYTTIDTWLAANHAASAGKAIGVITIAGDIVPGKAGPGIAGGDRIAGLLDDALDDDLAALVVRIDSPGGALIAGEQIRDAIARFKAKKIPVVVSMANLAASAGYWVATPADRIFAEPATVTGSIGVFAVLPSFEKALGSIGVNADGVRTTPLSGQPDPFAGYSPEFSDILQATVEFSYNRFVALVAQARGKTPQQIDAIAQGRVWDGGSARQLGLIDQFGGFDDALAYAARAAGAKEWHAQFLETSEPGFARYIKALSHDGDDETATGAVRDWAGLVAERQASVMSKAIADLERIGGRYGVQAYCLECPDVPRAAASPHSGMSTLPRTGLFDVIARLLALRAE